MDCCCAQLNNPPSTQTAKHLRLIPTCITAATPVQELQQQMSCCREQCNCRAIKQQQSKSCASIDQ
eukprot:5136804-Ditylum_brightwellii.AAC.1